VDGFAPLCNLILSKKERHLKVMRFVRVLGLAAVVSAIASAASYNVDFPNAARVGATELKPGKYKVSVEDNKAVFTSGKKVVAEAPATVETNGQKFRDTQISTSNSDVQSISVGGTNMKIVLKK
jgi:hypothetical protein